MPLSHLTCPFILSFSTRLAGNRWRTSYSTYIWFRPRSFDDGADLFQREGLWRLPLIHLAGNARYAGICAQLLRDRLVMPQPELLSICKHLWTDLKLARADIRLRILYSMAQSSFYNLCDVFHNRACGAWNSRPVLHG
jgi:hypothetical protein